MGSNRTNWGYFPVAIVGIGTRHSGGVDTLDKFWDVLKEGREVMEEVPPDRWHLEDFYDKDPTTPGKMVTRRSGFVRDMNGFDNLFFKISPREAASMDPQQRHLLEVSYEAFEDAGINPYTLEERCGVFVGMGMMDHAIQIVDTTTMDPYTLTGIAHSAAANRISYAFNFRGPSFAVNTACASGLTAIHLACSSLWNQECSIAVASACNLIQIPDIQVGFTALGVLSPEDRSSPFSSSANGFVRGDGWGTFVLKSLDKALADNDHIYSVICGSAIAANGTGNSLTMPHPPAQEEVMKEAYEKFGVSMSDVLYLEAHGTGTLVGDPLEAQAVAKAFARSADNPLKIGSGKGNFGHTEVTAGITAATKVALMFENRAIPPTANFVSPNPHIDFKGMNLDIVTRLEPFPNDDKQHIIGVNSFGFAGALAHCIFQGPPKSKEREITEEQRCDWQFGDSDKEGQPIVVPLSAKTPEALIDVAKQWQDLEYDQDALSVVSWLSTRRRLHENRLTVISRSGRQFRRQMKDFIETGGAENTTTSMVYSSSPRICLVFPGQGQWHANMGRQLYRTEPVFRKTIDQCDAIFKGISGWSLLEQAYLFVEHPPSKEYNPDTFSDDLTVTQASILFLQLGLFNLWRHWGVEPACVVGHSLGEVSAAYACGGMTLQEAVETIYIRSIEQGKLKGTGTMAALRMTPDEVKRLCEEHENIHIAAINAPCSFTIAGKTKAIEKITTINPRKAKQLRVQCAFHTPDMIQLEDTFKEKMRIVVKSAGGVRTVPFYSTVTGDRYDENFRTSYWWDNICSPVKFQTAIESIIRDLDCNIFLECAASATLLSPINQIVKASGVKIQLTTVPSGQRNQNDRMCALRALSNLHNNGVSLNWKAITRDTAVYTRLPPYPWQHSSFLVEPEYRKKRRLGLEDRTFKGQNGQLSLETFSFFNDRRTVKDKITFPESGFVEYMMEISSNGECIPDLHSVQFTKKIEWPEENTGVGTKKTTLRLDAERDANTLRITHSGQHCSVAEIAEGEKVDNKSVSVNELLHRCGRKTTSEEFYNYLNKLGLKYGPKFRVVQDVRLSDGGESLSYLEPPKNNNQKIQTTHLDACFQLLLFTVGATSCCYDLSRIESIRMNVPSLPPGEPIVAYAEVIDSSCSVVTGNVMMMKLDGMVMAEVKGCVWKSSGNIKSNLDVRQCLYKKEWQPVTSELPPVGKVAQFFEEAALRRVFPESMDAITRAEDVHESLVAVCRAYISHGLEQVPPEDRSHDFDQRYYCRLEKLMVDTTIKHVDYKDISRLTDEVLRKAPELRQEVSMIQSLGEHLPTTLRSPQTAMTLLAKPECMTSYFLDSLTTTFFYTTTAETVLQAVTKALETKTVVRLLEVGARMGGLTKHILERLNDMCLEGRVEYVFTDPSETSFPQARCHLAKYPFVKYQQLDIEQDPANQCFLPGAFDILICPNTLHATSSIEKAMHNVRELLVDEGWVVLIEATAMEFIAELVFGALQSCWMYEDDREDCCWMGQHAWKNALEKNGFADVIALSSPKELFYSVLVGRNMKEGEICQQLVSLPVKTEKRWLLASKPEDARVAKIIESLLPGTVTSLGYDDLVKSNLSAELGEMKGPVEIIFIWNADQTNDFEVLLCFLQQIQSHEESISKAWVVTFEATSGRRPFNSAGAGMAHAIANTSQIPLMSVDIPDVTLDEDKTWATKLVQKILGNKISDTELKMEDGKCLTTRLTRMELPKFKGNETAYWKLTHGANSLQMSPCPASLVISYEFDMVVPPGTVLVKVSSAGYRKQDSKYAYGNTSFEQNAYTFGSEFCGVLEKVGEDVDHFKVGDEVLGFGQHCFASHILADVNLVVKKPKNLSVTQAASVGVSFVTAYYCLIEQAKLKKGESVLIQISDAGVRAAAEQIATFIGADVISNDVMEGINNFSTDVLLTCSEGKHLGNKVNLLDNSGRMCLIADSGTFNFKLQKNVSLIVCNIDHLIRHQKHVVHKILQRVTSLMGEGTFTPLDGTLFPISDFRKVLEEEDITSMKKVVFHFPEKFKSSNIDSSMQLFKKNATYIVTAAESGISQAIARWIFNNGARHIAMYFSTESGKAKAGRTTRYLTGKGVAVYQYCQPVHVRGHRGGAPTILVDLKTNGAPDVCGVFCLGGYHHPEDEIPYDLTIDKLQSVLSAKVRQAEQLCTAIDNLGIELDYFVTLSNDNVAWGNPSAVASVTADSYLEAFALKRRTEGKAALNVQVGALRGIDVYEIGGQTTLPVNDEDLSMHVEEFTDVLGKLMQSPDSPPSVCITNQDWSSLLKICHENSLKFRHLAVEKRVTMSDCNLTMGDLQHEVKTKLGELLCVDPDTIDLRQPMINYGVDSLMAVEMVAWASRELGAVISQLDILGGITTALLLEKAVERRARV